MTAAAQAKDEADEVGRWLLELEAEVGKGGWDQRHSVWLVWMTPMGEDSASSPISLVALDRHELPPYNGPGREALRAFGDMLEQYPNVRAKILADANGQSLFAVAFAAEAWTIPPEDGDAWAGRFSQHPQRKEMRSVSAVDVNNVDYVVQRIRGEEPTIGHSRDGWKYSGGVPEGLARISYLLRMPPWLRGPS